MKHEMDPQGFDLLLTDFTEDEVKDATNALILDMQIVRETEAYGFVEETVKDHEYVFTLRVYSSFGFSDSTMCIPRKALIGYLTS